MLNLLLGLWLLSASTVQIGLRADFATLIIGAMLGGIHLSLHFGKVRKDKGEK